MDAKVIYHFTTADEWDDAQDKGSYEPPSYQGEGFIHCATEEQLESVMRKHFKQHENLVKLVIDPARLTQRLQYDRNEEQQQDFPHIYGPLNLEAVTQIVFIDPITADNENIDNARVK
jgi:uncharacterized protein (DUF952 family)